MVPGSSPDVVIVVFRGLLKIEQKGYSNFGSLSNVQKNADVNTNTSYYLILLRGATLTLTK